MVRLSKKKASSFKKETPQKASSFKKETPQKASSFKKETHLRRQVPLPKRHTSEGKFL